MNNKLLGVVCAVAVWLVGVGPASAADEVLRPFVLASTSAGSIDSKLDATKAALTGQGFEIVGEYAPYAGAHILVVTDTAMKENAAKSEFGGYGAAQRVALTEVDGQVQVSYTNPVYMAYAYRMAGDLSDEAKKLEAALGKQQDFGSEKGLTAKKLSKYHYMIGMQYFDDPSKLAKYGSYQEAVQAVASGIAAGKGGVSQVYRIDLPGKDETVFGVKLTQGCSSDEFIMSKIDFKSPRSTAHLPYELLVSGGDVYALHGRFRIAIDFPDLSMMGANSFASIMCAPGEIEGALTAAAGGEVKK